MRVFGYGWMLYVSEGAAGWGVGMGVSAGRWCCLVYLWICVIVLVSESVSVGVFGCGYPYFGCCGGCQCA